MGGIAQGFLRSVFGLGGLLLGLVLGAWNYWRIAGVLIPVVHSEMIADAIGFLLIAIVVMVLAGLLGSILSKAVHKVGLGCLDSLAGAVFGFFQGAAAGDSLPSRHHGVLPWLPSGLPKPGCPGISSAPVTSAPMSPRTSSRSAFGGS